MKQKHYILIIILIFICIFGYYITCNIYSSSFKEISRGYEFNWKPHYIDDNGNEIMTGNAKYNTYTTPITYYEKITLKIISEDVAIKINYYDDNDNHIYSTGWIGSKKCSYCTTYTNKIIEKNKKIRISINSIKENNSNEYTNEISYYNRKYKYSIIENEPKKIAKQASKTIQLPNAKFNDRNIGFTITGIAYSKKEDIFYTGNFGPVKEYNENKNSTIVKLSKDFTTNLGEIELYNLYRTKTHPQPQGITIDTTNNSIYFSDVSENKISHITTSGELLNTIQLKDYTPGIAYDSKRDSLWIIDSKYLSNIDKENGKVHKKIDVSDLGVVDQLYLDDTSDNIYVTVGANYNDNNYVYKINLITGLKQLEYILHDSYAIEGIYINKNKMYIGNDGYYHNGKITSNIVQVYDI